MKTPKISALLLDHLKRVCTAASGFRLFGLRWGAPWMTYLAWPLLRRLGVKRMVNFGLFQARLGECDLYTFANVFEDYPVRCVAAAMRDVRLVIDAGANVGAFSLLATTLADGHRIVAIEPSPENVSALERQSFAGRMEIINGALGPQSGLGQFVEGINSVTHSIDFSTDGPVQICSLDDLCPEDALVKMDIEGGEFEILRKGLPDTVRYLLLEWHPGPQRPEAPRELWPQGKWTRVSEDLYGSSMWFWQRGHGT